MSVAEIGQIHKQYVRLSDRFKSVWTFHQLSSGIFKNLLGRPVPFEYDFQRLYEQIRGAGEAIQTISPDTAVPLIEHCDAELDRATALLVSADAQIPPSTLRRFFERLRNQDEKILYNVIKFYLYAGATSGEQRDKLDFLLTRAGEVWVEERGEHVLADTGELRRTYGGLLQGMPLRQTDPSVAADFVREFHEIRDGIRRIERFDDLSSRQFLSRSRELKQQIGDAYFDVDVLIAVIGCNVETKNRFASLYRIEEERLLQDAQRLLDNEQAIMRGFGERNPDLIDEIARFKRFKAEFDQSRADSNVKHNVVAALRSSVTRLLDRLEGDFDPGLAVREFTEYPFDDPVDSAETVRDRFGEDDLLQRYLTRIVSVLESFDPDDSFNRLSQSAETRALRLEPWEISAFAKIFWQRARGPGETEDLLYLYLRSAALRIRIDDEARELADLTASPTPTVMFRVRQTLERASEFDDAFKIYLQEQIESSAANTHHIYRSRLRLLRAYSGLWLIYDQHQEHDV